MTFSIYFYLTLLMISPWPIFYSFMLYYEYIFHRNFPFIVFRKQQPYKLWAIILILPVMVFSLFILCYREMGLSINLLQITNFILILIAPISYVDLGVFMLFFGLFIITWILALRILYQYFKKCLLSLYLYYCKYQKFMYFCISSDSIIKITLSMWPFCIYILEKNLFQFLLPYLIIFDFIVHEGTLSKIFWILPWYYIYSLIRFGLSFFYEIHHMDNWDLSINIYGYSK